MIIREQSIYTQIKNEVSEVQDMTEGELDATKDRVLMRDFRKSDLNDLLDLFPRCFAKEFEVTGFDPDHVRSMVNRAFGKTGRLFLGLSRLFGREPMRFLVAEVDSKVVGTTIVNSRGKVGYISSVMVHPDYRRKGIATRLLKDATAHILRKRMRRAVLHVDSTNTPAIDVYTKLGFRPFEHIAHLIGETDSLSALEDTDEIKTRPVQKDDFDEVYNLIRVSEDPNRLKIFDFSKDNLKTPFLQRLLHFSTQKKIVAIFDGKIVGYAETSYTTPKQAGSISSIHAIAQNRSGEVERVLVSAGIKEIRKGGTNRIRVTVSSVKQELIETLKSLGFRESLAMDGMFIEV
jgi:ribosomal protein S18 acetylase RimI-like enzyme